jgi:GAF domain-containing protein
VNRSRSGNTRTILGVPLQREGTPIGVLLLHRSVMQPFNDKEIALAETFADQAVIAIENVRLFEAEQQRTRELTETLEQQTATSEVLRVISSSPGELEPVFGAMLDNATRICEAKFGTLFFREGDTFRRVATHNAPPNYAAFIANEPLIHRRRARSLDRLIETKQAVHVADMAVDEPEAPVTKFGRARTLVTVPMLKENELIGAIGIYRQEVWPFTDKQIALLQNFAAQAVIAIENTRLLNELRQSLERQSATSEVLQVISSSPGELKPVFQGMLENAVRVCGAKFGVLYLSEGNGFRAVAMHDVPPAFAEFREREPVFVPPPGAGLDQLTKTKQVVHITDYSALPPQSRGRLGDLGGARTVVNVPMFKDNEVAGAIVIYRQEVRPFTDKQIELLQNFAAQAVIAIENARLLNELRESLEQQTATSEVLKVISSSPDDLKPVFEAMLTNATRLCEAKFGVLFRSEGDAFRCVALPNAPPSYAEMRQREPVFRPTPTTAIGRAAATRQAVQIADVQAEPGYFYPLPGFSGQQMPAITGARTVIAVPMLKDDSLIGVIVIYRQEVRPFTDKQIELVKNFAAQAVIAIENTRLLNELRQRTADLTESLEQQTATSEVLRVISSSPGELQPVFQAMLENATRICEARFATLWLAESEGLRAVAVHNAPPAFAEARRQSLVPPGQNTAVSRVITSKEVEQVDDIAADPAYRQRDPLRVALVELVGARTLVVVPMLKEDELVGAISIYRQEVRRFTDKQIELLKNFAAQAVIAIENARLLNELRQRTDDLSESLEQQTATAKVLEVISSSPGDLKPVFEAILENAVRLFSVSDQQTSLQHR